MRHSLKIPLVLLLSSPLSLPVHADPITWNPPVAGNTSWATPTNWDGGAIPTSTDTAVFNGPSYNFQPALDSFTTQSINGLELGGAGSAALTIGTGTGTQTNSILAASGSSTITMNDVSGLAIGQQITGARIQSGTFITNIAGNVITLSRPTAGGNLSANTVLTFTSSLQLGSGGISVAAGTTQLQTIDAPIVVSTNQTWTNNSTTNNALTVTGATYLGNRTVTLSGAANSNSILRGTISGTGSLNIDTLGTVTMGPTTSNNPVNNSFTGGVTLTNGTLTLGGGGTGSGTANILGSGPLTINGGSINATGNIANSSLAISGQVWNVDWSYVSSGKNLKMGTGGISLGTASGTSRTITVTNSSAGTLLTLDGAISDGTTANSITKAGPGILVLGGASTYTGSTTIDTGTIRIAGASDRLPTATTLIVNGGASSGGTFDLNGLNQTVAGLSGGSGTVKGTIRNGLTATTSTLTVTGTSTFDGVIQDGVGTVGLTKSTGGTLTLTGAHTYTGATTISGGTLLVNGSLAAGSAVALDGGTLGGSGTIAGLVTTGGTSVRISPGNSPGTLTLSGGLNADLGGTFDLELGTSSDLIDLGSGVFTGSSAADGLIFNFTDSGGLSAGTAYTLLSFGSSTGLDYSDLLANTIPGGFTLDSSFGTDGFLISGTSLQVQFSAIPEPSAGILMLGGAVGLLSLRRKRRKGI